MTIEEMNQNKIQTWLAEQKVTCDICDAKYPINETDKWEFTQLRTSHLLSRRKLLPRG